MKGVKDVDLTQTDVVKREVGRNDRSLKGFREG